LFIQAEKISIINELLFIVYKAGVNSGKYFLITEDQNIDNIISGCKTGDRQAQEKLYRNFYRAMMSICLRYTKNETDAMEVLNNGFYKVFKNIQRYEPGKASMYTWIRTIIINSCLDFIKIKQKNIHVTEFTETAEIEITPEIISKIESDHLLQLIRKLTSASQTVFNLFIIEGYSHSEIAQLLHITVGTSKWHLSEARKKLQAMIKGKDVIE
jgi:RNA polymerase sigma factor (sigma-70 family)